MTLPEINGTRGTGFVFQVVVDYPPFAMMALPGETLDAPPLQQSAQPVLKSDL